MKLILLLVLILVAVSANADLYSEILLSIDSTDVRNVGVGYVTDHQQFRESRILTNGVSTNTPQADIVWHSSRILASGASESLDLRGGLVDTFGNAVDFVRVRGIMALNLGTTTIALGGDPAGPLSSIFSVATGGILLPGSGSLLLFSPILGYSVSTDTADLLRVDNAMGGTGSYKIMVLGNNH